MANEIDIAGLLSFTKSGSRNGLSTGPLTATMTGSNYVRNRQTVGTSEEQAVVGDAGATGGWCLFINRDATNYVEIRPTTGAAALIKMLPGEFALFRHAGVTAPFLVANTAPCEVEYLYLET
jgi:hypothetical protein